MRRLSHTLAIDGRVIGTHCPPYVVAELSANHNGSLQRALDTLDAVKKAGADAMKLQTYTADSMTIESDDQAFKIDDGLWAGNTLYQLYQHGSTPYAWHKALFDHARAIGLTLFSSPFDEQAVDLLESLGAPAYKIASFEMTDIPLISYVAKTGKPIIMSTGVAGHTEIVDALHAARLQGCKDIVLLQCTSCYPAPVAQANLRAIPAYAARYAVCSGLSDHTLGNTVAIAAVALGACMVEKHVTLDRASPGLDSDFSIEPAELAVYCEQLRQSWSALGNGCIDNRGEAAGARFRRSLYVVEDIRKGECFDRRHVRSIRPAGGLPPKYYAQLMGKCCTQDLLRGTALQMQHVVW